MFEKQLQDTFQKIFGLKKVSYDAMPEGAAIEQVREQECLFVRIEDSKNTFRDAEAICRVTGTAVIVGRAEKIPFGFFSKAIRNAPKNLTKDLFFYDIESNSQQYRDLVQRSFSFVFLFSSQYDPAIGTINSVTINVEENDT